MTRDREAALSAAASALLFAAINLVSVAAGPRGDVYLVLLACGVAAAAMGVQSAFWDPDTVGIALLVSLPPVVALAGGEMGRWLIGPLGALLLVACELNRLSWEARTHNGGSSGYAIRARNVAVLGGAGMAASIAVGAVGMGSPAGGMAALLVAAGALALLARVLFGPSR